MPVLEQRPGREGSLLQPLSQSSSKAASSSRFGAPYPGFQSALPGRSRLQWRKADQQHDPSQALVLGRP